MMNKRQEKTLRKRLEERRAEIESDMSYMAAEMRSIGVDQDEENGSLGNHIADDGSNVAEAERIVTVTEDLQQILVQVNAALERMNEGTYGTCQRCGNRSAKSGSKRSPMLPTASSASPFIEREQALRAGA